MIYVTDQIFYVRSTMLETFFTDCPHNSGTTLNQITLAPRPTGFVDLQCVIHGVVINRVRHYWWLIEKTVHIFLVIHGPSKLINDTINCHFAFISLGVLQHTQALANHSFFLTVRAVIMIQLLCSSRSRIWISPHSKTSTWNSRRHILYLWVELYQTFLSM